MVIRQGVAALCALLAAAAPAQLISPDGGGRPQLPVPAPPSSSVSAGAPVATGGAARAPDTYVLGAGDRVRITVFGEDRLSGEYIVTSSGELSFPLIGNLRASGTSVADLQALLRARLSEGYLKDPRVTAEVLIFRPFYVLGEVARPGQYPYVDGLTMQQAIATAGGYTYRAKRSKIFLRGPGQADEKQVNLKKTPLSPVGPGDTIRVGERFF